MKKIKILLVLIVAVLGFNSCEKDELVFTAKAPGEFVFTNNFLSQYVLTSATSANIGERFTWESQSFEVPTAVNYELQGSVSGDFTDLIVIGSTSGNDQAVSVGKLLSMAGDAGLDNDPNTEDPNTGDVYFRLRAYSGSNAIETFSAVQTLTLFLPEIVETGGGFAISSWGVVGSGYNDWGSAGPDAKFYYDYTTDTFKVGVKLIDGDIKIRPLNTWSGDLGDANGDGILDSDSDNNIAVTAGHYLITVDFKDNSYSIVSSPVWGAVGSGYNDWGSAGPDAALTEIQPGVMYADDITLIDGEIKFRPDNTWDGDLGDNAPADGILEPGDNIPVTAGNYVITIDFNDPDGPKYHLTKR